MRSEWRGAAIDDLTGWCAEAAATIAALADRLVAALVKADLKPSKLIGAGSIASRIMREAGADRWVAGYRPDRQPICNGTELLPLFYAAYYGGRQEMTVVGTWRDVPTYRYDLTSAYPWALSWLAPVGYVWEETNEWTNSSDDRMSVWYVKWNTSPGSLGPLPFRDVMGRTTYPLSGRGWYWWPEVQAAISAYGSSIRVARGFISPRSRRRPLLAQIARRYQQRKALEADGDPLADVLKTSLAACWGRLAQQLGEDCLPGRFYNVALAGWITSAIRARLIRAYAGKEGYICALMTDGILTTMPLDVRLTDELGGWREDTWSSASLILPGLYRLEADNRQVIANTGIADGVDFDALLRAVSHGGQARVPVRWFAPNLLADLYPERWEQSRCRWLTTQTTINPYRIARKRDGAETILDLDFRHDFAPTQAYRAIGDCDSEGAVLPPAWRPGGTTAVNEALNAIMRGKA